MNQNEIIVLEVQKIIESVVPGIAKSIVVEKYHHTLRVLVYTNEEDRSVFDLGVVANIQTKVYRELGFVPVIKTEEFEPELCP